MSAARAGRAPAAGFRVTAATRRRRPALSHRFRQWTTHGVTHGRTMGEGTPRHPIAALASPGNGHLQTAWSGREGGSGAAWRSGAGRTTRRPVPAADVGAERSRDTMYSLSATAGMLRHQAESCSFARILLFDFNHNMCYNC